MIKKVTIKNFKKFENAPFELNTSSVSLFVGPNNGGKTTALQAVSLWSYLIQEWNEAKGKDSKSRANKRTGTPVTRNALYAVPVQDIRLLWFNTSTQTSNQKKINIHIIVEGVDSKGNSWEYGVELKYANKEQAYCNPIDAAKEIPEDAFNVYHLPPLSGVQTLEKQIQLGAQRHSIGEGRPGEILRNMLLEVQAKGKWGELTDQIRKLFNIHLEPISFNKNTDAFIMIYYRPENWIKTKNKNLLEISNAGSGFLQFLLLASFLYVHENSILLLDEPDSHMHVNLQRGMYDWLQGLASKNNVQLLISTHSEVLINSTDTDYICTFFSDTPRKITGRNEQIIKALCSITPLDIINAQSQKFIFFAEGSTDLRIIKAWAGSLEHPVSEKLADIYFYSSENDQISQVREMFKDLKIVEPEIKGLFLRDKVSRTTEDQVPAGLEVFYWSRKEIENYLIIPDLLIRFIEKLEYAEGLFGNHERGVKAREFLKDNLPPKVYNNPLETDYEVKGSEFLKALFAETGLRINKSDYWEIAACMRKEEIHTDISLFLNRLYSYLE